MSNLERTSWKAGFPFVHNPFWKAPDKGTGRPDLSQMRVLDAHIPEGHALKSAYTSDQAAQVGTMPRRSPVEVLPPAARLQAQRPVGRRSGLRLLPLESFIWGSRGQPPRPRTRPDHTLIWVTAGRMQLDFPRDHDLMVADTIRVVPAGTAFAAVPKPGLAGHALLIAPDLLCDVDPPLPLGPLTVPTDEAGHALHLTLAELGEEAVRSAARQSLSCLLTLLSLRLSELRAAPPAEISNRPDPVGKTMVDRFLALAEGQLGRGQTVADLADAMGVTTATLDRACHAARGRRAVDLLNDLRLERAAHLLRQTRQSPTQIAHDLGYSSLGHFTRAFAAATGRSPEVFRAQSC